MTGTKPKGHSTGTAAFKGVDFAGPPLPFDTAHALLVSLFNRSFAPFESTSLRLTSTQAGPDHGYLFISSLSIDLDVLPYTIERRAVGIACILYHVESQMAKLDKNARGPVVIGRLLIQSPEIGRL